VCSSDLHGTLLDVDFGTYPFVTSSTTTCAGACTGLGIAPTKIGRVLGIFKAYCTRVGSGPFPTELLDETGERMRQVGREFGSTTGRARRCGWLDLPALKYAVEINGVTELMMMKADVLSGFESLQVCTHYLYQGQRMDQLPYSLDPQWVTPVYESVPGWNQDLTGMHTADQLPSALMDYVAYIEKAVGVPITLVSVGPDREQTIHRG
jgi:adenylosuccinate synthase